MDWLAVSILTMVGVSAAPLVFALVVLRYRAGSGVKTPDEVLRHRRDLVIATLAVWGAVAGWFVFDRVAIAAGDRPFAVALAGATAFAGLFIVYTARIVWPAAPDTPSGKTKGKAANGAPKPDPGTQSVKDITAQQVVAAGVFMAVSLVVVLFVLFTSNIAVGYRVAGAIMLIAGPAFALLALQRLPYAKREGSSPRRALLTALVYFCAFEAAAVLTLTINWSIPEYRWIGVGSQLAVGVLGIIGLAKMLAPELGKKKQ